MTVWAIQILHLPFNRHNCVLSTDVATTHYSWLDIHTTFIIVFIFGRPTLQSEVSGAILSDEVIMTNNPAYGAFVDSKHSYEHMHATLFGYN